MCVEAGSPDSIALHQARNEDPCSICASELRWRERVEMERFAHGQSRPQFLARLEREMSRGERW